MDSLKFVTKQMAEPTKEAVPPRGAMAMHLDIVTPEQRRSAAFLGGEAEGLTAEVMALVLPD